MKKHEMTENSRGNEPSDEDQPIEQTGSPEEASSRQEHEGQESAAREIRELNDKYLRLYAEFDNYRKRVNKDKEDIQRYGNESLLYELLPVLDNLELAIKHGSCEPQNGLLQGVEITLKEFRKAVEKFGLKKIEAQGKEFDPAVHHAMAQVEREDMEEKMVAEELRPGYLYHEKVLRPALVSVSMKARRQQGEGPEGQNAGPQNIEEE